MRPCNSASKCKISNWQFLITKMSLYRPSTSFLLLRHKRTAVLVIAESTSMLRMATTTVAMHCFSALAQFSQGYRRLNMWYKAMTVQELKNEQRTFSSKWKQCTLTMRIIRGMLLVCLGFQCLTFLKLCTAGFQELGSWVSFGSLG